VKKVASILITAFLLVIAIAPPAALAEETYYTVTDESGNVLCRIGGEVYIGDEYIASDNRLYRIDSANAANKTATAVLLGEEPAIGQPAYAGMDATLAQMSNANDAGKKLVGIYCTHSDESYEPTDGLSSSEKRGGIYDVAQAFSAALNERGIETIVDETLHHPHDAGAYRRSQSTAANLAKQGPAALIDIHRDGVPADEYITQIDGQETTMIRLLVGRSNANSQANREFAKQIKASADEIHPGLIKDIFIGKGNYNQELMPHAILFEFGTHKLKKERAIVAASLMADVIQAAVFGEAPGVQTEQNTDEASETQQARSTQSAQSTQQGGAAGAQTTPRATQGATAAQQGAEKPAAQSSRGVGTGVAWMIALFVVGLVVAGLIIGGKNGLFGRLKRTASEMTGGAVGKKPDDDDRLS
jgi:stage II sporulation protein P